ncbi:MAG TPA: VOC family protein [Beijerinckiaceae bacterium]|nr:VOC family protein [Beijerinckiaceae bacterium]
MRPQALGYLGVRAKDLDDWAGYGAKLLGLQIVDRSRSTLAFRMDDRKQRIVVNADGGEGIGVFGWEMADADALDALAAHLDRAGVKATRGSRALAQERQAADLVVIDDPMGNRLEFFYGAETTDKPFSPGRNISGFRAGPLGLGHVVMNVPGAQIDETIAFYRDVLGFGVSDFYDQPFKACFFHVNPRHHSLAFVQSEKAAVHHLMMEMFSFDDMGQGLDLALREEGRLAVTLGRHAGDYMTSFYTWTPSAFMVESGWGGRLIDPESWVAAERREGPSLWGHERSWLSPDKREAARRLCLDNAEKGLRRPVHVLEGNHVLMPGTCPWWDSVRPAPSSESKISDGSLQIKPAP